MKKLLSIDVENFRSLGSVRVHLNNLSVLVGPNGAGKTNLLRAIEFLGDVARLDLAHAIDKHGGFDNLLFRGTNNTKKTIKLGIKAIVTKHASENALDEYSISFYERPIRLPHHPNVSKRILSRREIFQFKRTPGRGRRITASGGKVEFTDTTKLQEKEETKKFLMASSSAALATLRRLGKDEGAEQIDELATLFESFRVFEVDTLAARQPSNTTDLPRLASDARNLASYIHWLSVAHEEVFKLLVTDLCHITPTVEGIEFTEIGGAGPAVALALKESGLRDKTYLRDASFGTVRALALLAMLHDPNPPQITCVEEIDHGLHPYALDRIVLRMREASARTQLLVATHSPALVNRLDPHELIVCERDNETGASRIPAIESECIAEMARNSSLLPGELWFSGALGGVL